MAADAQFEREISPILIEKTTGNRLVKISLNKEQHRAPASSLVCVHEVL
jgi:hypothetical protein